MQFSLPRQKDALREHVERNSAAASERGTAQPYYIVKPDVGSLNGIRARGDATGEEWSGVIRPADQNQSALLLGTASRSKLVIASA